MEDYTFIASCYNLSKLFIPEPDRDDITNRLIGRRFGVDYFIQ